MKSKFYSYDDARKVILKDIAYKNIKGYDDWQNIYIKSVEFPNGIPKQPQITYKNKGWVSWGEWLNTGRISNIKKNCQFLNYQDAKSAIALDIAKYNINSMDKWHNFYVKNNLIANLVPTNPNRTYKNKGWVSWGEWLNTGNVSGGFNCRLYVLDENFFSQWSPDMAYVLGFWWADGCMKDHRRFSIYQHQKDSYLLYNILDVMGSNYPVHNDKRHCCYIEISSFKLCNDIVNLGGTTKKSLTIQFPNVPEIYLRDFIRGLFDGDGCITYDKNSKKYMSYISSASPRLLRNLQFRLRETAKIDGHINNQISIKFNASDTIKMGQLMYYENMNKSLMMIRKHEKFMLASTSQGITGFGNMI